VWYSLKHCERHWVISPISASSCLFYIRKVVKMVWCAVVWSQLIEIVWKLNNPKCGWSLFQTFIFCWLYTNMKFPNSQAMQTKFTFWNHDHYNNSCLLRLRNSVNLSNYTPATRFPWKKGNKKLFFSPVCSRKFISISNLTINQIVIFCM